ncbi:hypothetical protein [Nocardia sp. CC227C]|uniref:hypothetical protein n=1 Tax=Nocardia sp. CC227C TaxID=3044562 RepID=UPI00278C20C1|nr:hypothetical protein [Nocardia sp. CC227C]
MTVRRAAFRAPDQANSYPADTVLSLRAHRHSHGLARAAVLEAVRSSYDSAHAAITRVCGPVSGRRQLEDLVTGAATDVADFYHRRVPQHCPADTTLALTVDAKGILMRPSDLREQTRRAAAAAAPVGDSPEPRPSSPSAPSSTTAATSNPIYAQ